VSLCAARCVAQMPLLSPRGGVCSALVLSVRCRTEPVEEDAKTNCLCHLSEPMLCAAARHVMVSCGRSCLPAALSLALCSPAVPFACLLTAWPVTPVPACIGCHGPGCLHGPVQLAIYGNRRVLFVRYVLCGWAIRHCTRSVVAYVCT
jgi:hypothetical protein